MLPDWFLGCLALAGLMGVLVVLVAWLETRGGFGVDPGDEDEED